MERVGEEVCVSTFVTILCYNLPIYSKGETMSKILYCIAQFTPKDGKFDALFEKLKSFLAAYSLRDKRPKLSSASPCSGSD